MLLLKTSINLRNDLPWNDLYSKCIYPWLNGSINKKTGKKNYERLLRKLKPEMDIKENHSEKIEFAGDFLQYDSIIFKGEEYLCFVHGTLNSGCLWRTRVALKRTSEHLLCYVSLDGQLERAASFPKFSKPRIIDYLIKFQDGDGDIEFKEDAHILNPSDINDAKNILLGKKKNKLPIVYLSCAERTHALKPSELAKTLYGVAHVYAERDNSLYDRIKIDIKTPFPQKGAIGICYPGKPISIINRNGAKPDEFVQKIYLSILKNSLSAEFDFSWEAFNEVLNLQKREIAEQEKQITLAQQQKEQEKAKQESRQQQRVIEANQKAFEKEKIEALLNKIKDIKEKQNNANLIGDEQRKILANYMSLKIKFDDLSNKFATQAEETASLKQELTNAKADRDHYKEDLESIRTDRDTFKSIVEEQDKEIKELNERNNNLEAANTTYKEKFKSKRNQCCNYIPLIMPTEDEMYENETLCQLVYLLQEAPEHFPRAKVGYTQRSFDVFKAILKNNADALGIFKEMEAQKKELESYAEKALLKTERAGKIMRPFGISATKMSNGHYEIKFEKDQSKRYKGVEAGTPSNKRGSINGGNDTLKALLW